ncbi:MAG: choice-of-anchor B family protein, partial [Planctomycetes bacterium]|nr:choice-of-anchor B family protein [Planctomycetota bacterium]
MRLVPGRMVIVPVMTVCLIVLLVIAHDDDQFNQDRISPYEGSGYQNSIGGAPAIEFPASGITLLSWIPLMQFAPEINRANDCWGYVSPSGREYAIIGLSHGTAFVEVTNPGNPQIVGSIMTGPISTWRDIKTYQTYAYAVSEAGSGIQVFDLSQIDSGIVTLVNTVTDTGSSLLTTTASHNVAINETSGYLYRCGGGGAPAGTLAGLRIYDLSIPASPAYVGDWTTRYIHDAQIVNWTTGALAGHELAFCFSNDNSPSGNPGVDILDVTDKTNILSLPLATYDNPAYSHQGWLSPDHNLLYLNDELDDASFGTRLLDVSDPALPVQVGSFTNGNTSIDHNLYTKGNFIYESNYRSGLRIFDATNPLAPVDVAFFDTWPDDDHL